MTITDRSGGVASASSPNSTDRRLGLAAGVMLKLPCVAATTAAITLSGEQTIDGVACVADDRVLVKDQASSAFNGIYDVSTGPWTRSTDFDEITEIIPGTLVQVISGNSNGGRLWYVSSAAPTAIDSSAITFATDTTDLQIVMLSRVFG